jgi:hypothetical protein
MERVLVRVDGVVEAGALPDESQRVRGIVEEVLSMNFYAQPLLTADRWNELGLSDDEIGLLCGRPELNRAREHLTEALAFDATRATRAYGRHVGVEPEWHDWAIALLSASDRAFGGWLKDKGMPGGGIVGQPDRCPAGSLSEERGGYARPARPGRTTARRGDAARNPGPDSHLRNALPD